MGRRTLLLITSILIAAVGTALVAIYVRGADERGPARRRSGGVALAPAPARPPVRSRAAPLRPSGAGVRAGAGVQGGALGPRGGGRRLERVGLGVEDLVVARLAARHLGLL